MSLPRFTRPRTAFLIGVPLAWALLLLFHPIGSGEIYASLRDVVTRFRVVHVGSLVFIGLMAVAVHLLLEGLNGRAATVSRLALGPFVLFYAAWEAVAGLADPALAQHTNGLPAAERPVAAGAIDGLHADPIVGDFGILNSIGATAWIVAVIAAAVAIRGAGAPRSAWVLLGLSALVASHPPPFGPLGLAFFAAAVVILRRGERVVAPTAKEDHSPVPTVDVGARGEQTSCRQRGLEGCPRS